jgi:predicted Zn-ribbon and HTH transcriptional regulator
MVAYYCPTCNFYYRIAELVNSKCPECKSECKLRLILAGMVMGQVK